MSHKSIPKLDWRVVFNRSSPPNVRGWGRVRAAQLQELGRSLTLASWGQALNALFVVLLLQGSVPPMHLAGWLLCLAILFLVAGHRQRKMVQRDLHYVHRRALDGVAYYSIAFAFLWSVPARYFFTLADHPTQLAIVILTASLMAGAVFIFSTLPAAATVYVVIMGVASMHMLMSTGSVAVTMIAPVFTIGLVFMILVGGRAFMQRKLLDFALEERTETVSLLLREFEDSDADWLWQTNSRLAFTHVSPRFARALGRPVHELEGASIVDILGRAQHNDPAHAPQLALALAAFEQRAPISEIVAPLLVDGAVKCIELSARPRFNRQGRFQGYQGVGSDITEARQAADRIAHMARHDALTGLPNRLQLMERLEAALDAARDTGAECAVLLVDLDRFKTINDSLGHVAGDYLLQQVSDAFRAAIGGDMVPGRLGGDEFAIVVPSSAGRAALSRTAEAIIAAAQGPFHYNDQRLFVGASIGIATGPRDGATVEELIRNADLALYRAKEAGGNDTCFYEPRLHAQADERRRMELALRSALDESEFRLVYQPIVDAHSQEIESFEALLRWSNPVFGQVSPARFIPLAEETGLIGRIGEWVLRTACAEAAKWPANIAIAINVSARQLQDPNFIVTLISAITQSGIAPHRLELEVTESLFLELTPRTQKVLNQIQGLGVRLAMDDFGTGYSSLGYLRKAEFDTLKIDRSFIQGLADDDPESSAIIRAVVALAGSLGMKTVAEGVASAAQLDMVRALGCDRMQGYLFSRPVSGAAARALLGRRGDDGDDRKVSAAA